MSARPDWCPHADCAFVLATQDVLCVGRLPEPVLHDGFPNDGRICLKPFGDSEVYDFQINSGDAWNIKRLLHALYLPDGKAA